MDAPGYRDAFLFDNEGPCCLDHACVAGAAPSAGNPGDVLTYVDETFDDSPGAGGSTAGAWSHGGAAAWSLSRERSRSGTTALRSGDLAGARGASSDASLAVASSRGARVSFWLYSDVARPFDWFEFRIDDAVRQEEAAPGGGRWKEYEFGVPPGRHDLSFRVRSPEAPASFDRGVSVEGFGTGVAYVDDLKFTPFN